MHRLALLGLLATTVAIYGVATVKGEKKVDTRVFELRTYTVLPGRMSAMHARFRDHTNKLLKKHGMTLIGFWNPTDEKTADTKLIYLVAHASAEAAKKSWDEFRVDPEWIAARDASEKSGKIVEKVESVFMNPTDYSEMK